MRSHLNRQYRNKVALGMLALAASAFSFASADVVLDDFSSGVIAVNHPEGSGQFGVWYDATNATYGTPVASSLDGNPAMQVTDGGYGNGVYIIYEAVVPADGEYSIKIDMKVDESGSPTGFSQYQVGVAVGADAQHRGINPSALPGTGIVGDYSGLTSGDDSANPTQTVTTPKFTASAGDSILISLGTDVVSGGWGGGSSLWSGNSVFVDNIVLVDEGAPPPPPPDEPVVLEDFESGIVATNNPDGAGQYNVWYDVTSATYGTPQPSTLEGSNAMYINDGGYANGVYAIYPAAIPAAGTYTIEASIDIVEAGDINGIRSFQMGAATGAAAQHRSGSLLDATPITATYIGLTPNDDTANPTQVVISGEFTANAGDDVLVAFSTDVESGQWKNNSFFWSGSYVLVDNITIRPVAVEPPPFELILDNDDGPAVYASTGFSTSGSTGFDGGTYQFAGTGSADTTATWTGTIPEDGYYEVSTIYRAGTNRAAVASYEVETAEGVEVITTDQRANDLSWVTLGQFPFNAGEFTITLNAETSEPLDAGTVIIADAVRVRELEGPPPIEDPELRVANLLVYDQLDDIGTIQSFINDIARKRYNAVAVHTRYRGDATYFPNKYDSTFPNNEPRNEFVGDVDVLEEVVTRGHAAGLKVFAYVNTMLVTEGDDTDPRPNHVLNQHPEWVTWEWNGGNPEPHTTETEIDGIWLDPALPEVQLYNANICADIVMNYDVDGIMIDRQRYPDTRYIRTEADYGYHPDAVEQFNRLTGKTGIPDQTDEEWLQFRRDANTRAIQMIYSTINSIDPDVLLLSYPIGRYTDAKDFNYQDWAAWLDNEVIDIVIPQIYTSSNADFSARAAEHAAAYTGERMLGVALDVFRPGTDLAGQDEIAEFFGFAGTAMFHHSAMGPLGYFEQLAEIWPGIAPFPETPWNSEEAKCQGLDIIGFEEDDLLVGTICDELIVGWVGADELIGSGGDDLLVPDASAEDEEPYRVFRMNRDDIVDGGEGNDTVDYSMVRAPIRVDLSEGIARKARGNDGIGTDILISIENVIGREGGDEEYIGDDGPNMIWSNGLNPTNPSLAGERIWGNGGDDYINTGGPGVGSNATHIWGGSGNDEIHGNDGRSNKQWGEEGDDTIYAYGGQDHIWGGPGNDYLDGGDGTDFIFGEEGDDIILGGAGKDKVLEGGPGNDTIDGGFPVQDDRVKFSGTTADYEVCEFADGTLIITDLRGIDGTDTVTNINRIIFSDRMVTRSDFAKYIPNYSMCE